MRASSLILALSACGFLAPAFAGDACFRDCEDILCAARCWSADGEDGSATGRPARGGGGAKPALPVCPPLGPVAVRDLTVPFAGRTYFVEGVGACVPEARP